MMKATLAATVLMGAVLFDASTAAAVTQSVKSACSRDYFSFCSMHAPSSPGVRRCFRANASRISTPCIKALKKAGYVSGKSAKLR